MAFTDARGKLVGAAAVGGLLANEGAFGQRCQQIVDAGGRGNGDKVNDVQRGDQLRASSCEEQWARGIRHDDDEAVTAAGNLLEASDVGRQ